ncbi:MAG: hypothetical protein DRO12_05775 [Thermoprotei archaeon]|nr:MAG: hypothetical protein DRO12_05775 [Thermoprotei archaeon]
MLELLKKPRVRGAVSLERGYALLYRGERDVVEFVDPINRERRILYGSGRDEVIPYIEKLGGRASSDTRIARRSRCR